MHEAALFALAAAAECGRGKGFMGRTWDKEGRFTVEVWGEGEVCKEKRCTFVRGLVLGYISLLIWRASKHAGIKNS